MANDNVTLGGFDLIPDLAGNPGGISTPAEGFEHSYVDPADIDKFVDEAEDTTEETTEETEETTEETTETTETTETEETEETEETTEEAEEAEDVTEVSEEDKTLDKDLASFLKNKFEEDHGITFSDDPMESIDDVVAQLSSIVEEGSKPVYANDEVAKYDEFVRNGGSLRSFYKDVFENKINTEDIDMTSEFNQKAVLREQLLAKGYKEASVDSKIERYDTAGVLEDEALDALDLLKDYNSEKEKTLLEDKKKESQLIQKQQREFVSNVETTIDEMSDIRGIKLTKQEKSSLKDYLFKPSNDGMTDYQKDYMNNTKNLVESAFFTKNGESLIKKAQDKAASDALKKVQKTFKSRQGTRQKGSGGQSASGTTRSLGQLSGLLLRKD